MTGNSSYLAGVLLPRLESDPEIQEMVGKPSLDSRAAAAFARFIKEMGPILEAEKAKK